MKALNKARKESGDKVLGTYLIGGMNVPKIEQIEPSIEIIKVHREIKVNW